ncbi:phosphoenolpyruvate--protein phosphotransferase [Hydrogenoanaerobacterium sp.]|uniref:phosphoenolpyruvate--protein phosphotransferase n=1 Tax=Hydrogenoanaerobacterium sp. TaxID=2953763 RepID=UPI00289631D0|nr:phosphoenolpyruvate--protein phosphotransferase [Hydrogenoanaerobacterium sp.]
MEILKGVGASKGIAIGRLLFYTASPYKVEKKNVEDTVAEQQRFEEARQKAIDSLNRIYEKALLEIGEEDSLIFQIHAMMLDDLDYVENITGLIANEKVNAEYAVSETAKQFAAMFSSMDDEYMKQRSADVFDVSKSLVRELASIKEQSLDDITGQVIVAADDLMPSETVQLDKSKVLAFVTRSGSKISHSAILARTMGIPAVVGLDNAFDSLTDEGSVIVDGFTGSIYVEPDCETMEQFTQRREEYLLSRKKLLELKDKPSETLDGIKIEINANIGHPSDITLVQENGAEGIGLFRSEFLYMDSDDFPTEDTQFAVYKEILTRMKGQRVIVRTLDLGADKHVPYFNISNEDNPAMGYRAIRICLTRPEIFITQLRALLRASVYGRLAIMVPMVTSLDEVLKTKEIIEAVKAQLKVEGIEYADHFEFGIMIETPAAVMISDILAQHVDFFSIGTNDLTQYTLAVDRMNHTISHLYDPRHLAVLRMMKLTVENGKKHGIWTGICGESAADLELIPTFLAMGVEELSVTPTAVLDVRQKVCETNLNECRADILQRLDSGISR